MNMAAAVGRFLSFSKNAKVLVSPLRLSALPAHHYSIEVSSTGEAITHTGQVSLKATLFSSLLLILVGGLTLANVSLGSVWLVGPLSDSPLYDFALNVFL